MPEIVRYKPLPGQLPQFIWKGEFVYQTAEMYGGSEGIVIERAYLPAILQAALYKTMSENGGQPCDFAVEIWCEPIKGADSDSGGPVYRYAVYDRARVNRRQIPSSLLAIAGRAGMLAIPAHDTGAGEILPRLEAAP